MCKGRWGYKNSINVNVRMLIVGQDLMIIHKVTGITMAKISVTQVCKHRKDENKDNGEAWKIKITNM